MPPSEGQKWHLSGELIGLELDCARQIAESKPSWMGSPGPNPMPINSAPILELEQVPRG